MWARVTRRKVPSEVMETTIAAYRTSVAPHVTSQAGRPRRRDRGHLTARRSRRPADGHGGSRVAL